MFDTYKSTLSAEALLAGRPERLWACLSHSYHFAYTASSKLELHLKKAELNRSLTPIDFLLGFNKLCYINFRKTEKVMEGPKKVRGIEAELGTKIFPN